MSSRQRIGIKDIQVGRMFWAQWDTYFNGEGGVEGVAIIRKVSKSIVEVDVFKSGSGLEDNSFRKQKAEVTKTDIEKGKINLFLCTDKQIASFINRSIDQLNDEIQERKDMLADFRSLLKT